MNGRKTMQTPGEFFINEITLLVVAILIFNYNYKDLSGGLRAFVNVLRSSSP